MCNIYQYQIGYKSLFLIVESTPWYVVVLNTYLIELHTSRKNIPWIFEMIAVANLLYFFSCVDPGQGLKQNKIKRIIKALDLLKLIVYRYYSQTRHIISFTGSSTI